MSDELLDPPSPVVHDIRHDIHSFYWVLIWVVLRHTAHNMPRRKGAHPSEACARVFKQGSSEEAADAKRSWFYHESKFLVITGNSPLTALVNEFGALLRSNRGSPDMPLDYDEVLEVFDRALVRQDWPESNDGPVRYTLPTLVPVNGWVFEDVTPKKRHANAHAGKGKEAAVVSESDSDDEIDEDDINETYESDASSADDADVAPHGLNLLSQSDRFLVPQTQKLLERLRMGNYDDDDAAEVSALLGYDEDDEDDIPMIDVDDRKLPSVDEPTGLAKLLKRLSVASPKKKATPRHESAAAGPSRVTRGASQRSGATTSAELNSGPEQRVGPQTRARAKAGVESLNAPHSEGSVGSGPRTRSAARRGGNSGTTRSEGGSQTGSRGSRKTR